MAGGPDAAGDGTSAIRMDLVGRLEQELDAVYASASWRITAPLRTLADVARDMRARMRSGKG
jgi:hypothetical protein